ncbi:Putative hydrolase or acyltransferase of alpha/beta superfamily [Sphingomonas antarctica]|uniref:alpha/beta fold hydrolase n=1 Tax=Sphingomonas antarctica TaxID=2040274 RepID=UPI0039EB1108
MTLFHPLRGLALLATLALVQPILSAPAHCATPVTAPARFTATVTGKGPDVILIPGLASSAHVWDATVAQISQTNRVHVIQVAGFAGSPAGPNATGPVLQPLVDDIQAYILANHLKAPAVIGHSMGGLAGMMLAADHPADVGKLMIVDSLPWVGMMFGPGATPAALTPRIAAMRDAVVAGTQEAYAAAEPAQMARLIKSTGPAAQAAIAAASASDHRVVGQAIADDFGTDMRPRLATIQAPVTMLYPWDATSGVPQAAFDALYTGAFASLPHKTVKRIDGSYHFIMIDQPSAFAAEVDAFLGK